MILVSRMTYTTCTRVKVALQQMRSSVFDLRAEEVERKRAHGREPAGASA